MFTDKVSAGKHLICDIKDITNTALLNSREDLESMMQTICNVCCFEILSGLSHDFIPIGCSIIFLLSESHCSLHTFPEKNYISFDLYTCRQYDDNEVYETIFNYLIRELGASSASECKIIDRSF